jgi:hypothetical protein
MIQSIGRESFQPFVLFAVFLIAGDAAITRSIPNTQKRIEIVELRCNLQNGR